MTAVAYDTWPRRVYTRRRALKFATYSFRPLRQGSPVCAGGISASHPLVSSSPLHRIILLSNNPFDWSRARENEGKERDLSRARKICDENGFAAPRKVQRPSLIAPFRHRFPARVSPHLKMRELSRAKRRGWLARFAWERNLAARVLEIIVRLVCLTDNVRRKDHSREISKESLCKIRRGEGRGSRRRKARDDGTGMGLTDTSFELLLTLWRVFVVGVLPWLEEPRGQYRGVSPSYNIHGDTVAR